MNEKILIVDDEESILFTFQHILSKNGYDVSVANDLEVAKELIASNDYDVALVDRVLSGGQNGIDLIKHINGVQPLCQTILASAYPSFESAAEILHCDCVEYLTKPVKRDKLLISIEQALHHGREKRRLRLKESLFSSLYERFPMSMIIYDTSGKVCSINSNFSDVFGYDLDTLSRDSLIYVRREDRSKLEYDINNLLKDGRHEEREIVCVTNDGRNIEMSVKLSLCRDKNNSESCILMTLHDLSEKRIFEKQLFITQKMETMAALANGIAHDLNHLLSIIIGRIQLIQLDENLSEMNRDSIDHIVIAARKNTQMLSQILSLGKKKEGSFSVANVEHTIADASSLLRILLPKSINVVTNFSHESKLANINPVQIEQCLINLGLNARDAMVGKDMNQGNDKDTGHRRDIRNEITISTDKITINGSNGHLFPGVNDGEYVVIRFADTGRGIPDHVKSNIFEPFFSTKPHGEGTGLGLYTTQKTIRNHLGFITVESELGRGASFTIFLPATAERLDAPDRNVIEPRSG